MLVIDWENGETTRVSIPPARAGLVAKHLNGGGKAAEWKGVYYVGAHIRYCYARVEKNS
jgi:hypothetical protein